MNTSKDNILERTIMNPKEIAEFLKQLRIANHLTQNDLAKVMHVTPQAVSRWENSNSIPDVNTLRSIADFYGISVDEILNAKKIEVKPIEVVKPKPRHKVLLYMGVYLGIIVTLFGMSLFYFAFNVYQMHIMFVVLGLIVSSLIMFSFRNNKFLIQYAIITGLLVLIAVNALIQKPGYFFINHEERLQLTHQKDIVYPHSLGFDAKYQLFDYVFDQYALIYRENEPDIDVFNLTEYYNEEYYTISTHNMIVKELLVINESIYLTTFIEDIPGEFKLYEFDFETETLTLLFESMRIYKLFEAYERLYLMTDPLYDMVDSEVYQLVNGNEIELLVTLDYQIYDLNEYWINYQQKLLISTHDFDTPYHEINFKVLIVDSNNFEIEYILLENLENTYHFYSTFRHYYGVNPYNGNDIYQFENHEARLVLSHEHADYFQLLSEEFYLIDYMLYNAKHEKLQDFMFYDTNNKPSSADLIINDGNNNYYVIDNEFMGFAVEYSDDPETWNIPLGLRLGIFIPSLLTIGLFISLGQRRKEEK